MNTSLKDFYFFSHFLNRKVYDASNRRVGKIVDLVAERTETYPMVMGIVIRPTRKNEKAYLPWEKILCLEPQVTLTVEEAAIPKAPLSERDGVWLREEVMDKQIVDTFGAKVVRVNDLHLLRIDSHLRLVHVDVGFRGLMRRVGWERFVDQVLHWLFSYELPNQFISWKYVQLLSGSTCST